MAEATSAVTSAMVKLAAAAVSAAVCEDDNSRRCQHRTRRSWGRDKSAQCTTARTWAYCTASSLRTCSPAPCTASGANTNRGTRRRVHSRGRSSCLSTYRNLARILLSSSCLPTCASIQLSSSCLPTCASLLLRRASSRRASSRSLLLRSATLVRADRLARGQVMYNLGCMPNCNRFSVCKSLQTIRG